MEISKRTASAEDTFELGKRVGENLTDGDILCLRGTLGAGKTTLSRGIIEGWGATTKGTSPTFTLINVHDNPKKAEKLFHIDAYRLRDETDAISTGIEDIIHSDEPVIIIIEWPERIKGLLPENVLNLVIEIKNKDSRDLSFAGNTNNLLRVTSTIE